MSSHADHHDAPAATTGELFSPAEVEQFAADDVEAGGAIGKMLTALFFYTVVAMSIAGWWTWSSIEARKVEAAESHHEHEHGTHEHDEAAH